MNRSSCLKALFLAGKRDAAKIRMQLGTADSAEPQAVATLTPTPEAESVPASVPETISPPEQETIPSSETVPVSAPEQPSSSGSGSPPVNPEPLAPFEAEASTGSPESVENGVDPKEENGYDEGDRTADSTNKIPVGRRFTAEEISKEFGRPISQEHVDAHQEVYGRYYELKKQGLSHSKINEKLLDEMLRKSVDAKNLSEKDALAVKKSVAKAYKRSAVIDTIDRNLFYDIKNDLIPYEPETQFPNAYKIYNEKFTSKTDLGVFISEKIKNQLEDSYNAWGRESENGKSSALFTISFDDATAISNQIKMKEELAEVLGLKSNDFKTGVWLGKIDSAIINNMRISTKNELGANKWWVPGLRTAGGQFETVIGRLENLKGLVTSGKVVFKKLMD